MKRNGSDAGATQSKRRRITSAGSPDPTAPFSAEAWIAAAHRLGYRFRIGVRDRGALHWYMEHPRDAGEPVIRLWQWLRPDIPGRGRVSKRREAEVIDHLARTLQVVGVHESEAWSSWSTGSP